MWKILFLLCNFSVVVMSETVRYVNVTCSTSDYGSFKDIHCFVKNGLLTAEGTLTRSLVNPKIYQKLFKKDGKTYRQIIKFPPIDICSFKEGISVNPFAKILVNYFRSYAPNAAQKCPWKGTVGVSNFTLENAKIVAMFPSGIYRQILGYADDKDDKIFHFEYNIVLSTGIASNN